ncbi:MAG: hypothetical protein AAGD11_11770 [Planctomycetota bacterium]
MPMHTAFNLGEAVFWVVVGLILVWRSQSAHPSLRRVAYAAAASFIVFAGTDLIEARTGAWYQPTGLLVYNAVCLILLLACYFWYHSLKKSIAVRQTEPSKVEGRL